MMDELRETLSVFRRYMEAVASDRAPAPTCSLCEAVLLYYVDSSDEVYWQCAGCGKVSYPGITELNYMKTIVERA